MSDGQNILALREPMLDVVFDVGPGVEIESWRLRVPAKGACYVMEDEGGAVVLLGTTANLRNALAGKLGPGIAGEPSRKIDYAAVVRRVKYRPVFSRFEANWAYMENARALLPGSYRKLIRHWRAWWVAVNLGDEHPRFVAAESPVGPAETCFGPLPDAAAARRYVELLEDLFDLCRYHNILVRSPHGAACAYKQMERCGAPCDGSMTLAAYRAQIEEACRFITEPREQFTERLKSQMKSAAAELRFERAALLKRQLGRVDSTGSADGPRIAPLRDFRFVSLQRGSKKGNARVFAVSPGVIELVGEIEMKRGGETAAAAALRVGEIMAEPAATMTRAAAERVALAGWELFSSGEKRGVFIPAEEATAERIAAEAEAMTEKSTGDAMPPLDLTTARSETVGEIGTQGTDRPPK